MAKQPTRVLIRVWTEDRPFLTVKAVYRKIITMDDQKEEPDQEVVIYQGLDGAAAKQAWENAIKEMHAFPPAAD